jgi:hypothetical protein
MSLDTGALLETVETLRQEHRILDSHIARLMADPAADEMELRRLKKRKLQIKDEISRLAAGLAPLQIQSG